MHLEVKRYLDAGEVTFSRVYLVDGETREFLCDGLEDQAQEQKVYGKTRIPAGTYPVTLRHAGKFHDRYSRRYPGYRGIIWVQDVPNFEFILWHIGNYAKDTDGCLLLGVADHSAKAVWSSEETYLRVYEYIAPMIEDGRISEVRYLDP